MNTILLIIIAVTAIVSYTGFQKPEFFEKYKFNVGAIQQNKEYIRLLSAGFLHADLMHFIFNMLTLYFFGPIVIQTFGGFGFLFIYLGSIIIGNLFSLFIYKNQYWYSAIGASGGVSGVLFAAIAVYPMMGIAFMFIPIPIPGYLFGLLYFGYSAYSMLNPRQNDYIGHAAHLGGAVLGLLYAVAVAPQAAISNAPYLGIMSLPLLYLGYQILVKKRIG